MVTSGDDRVRRLQERIESAFGGSASEARVWIHGGRIARAVMALTGHPAMVLGRHVLLGRSAIREIEAESREGVETLAEELLHAQQYARLGFLGFLRRYLRAYFELRRRGLPHEAAYLAIPLEVEAREGASRLAAVLLAGEGNLRGGDRIARGDRSGPESDERPAG